MNKKEFKKRAELTSTMLVTIILLLAGFVIILLIYYQIDWTEQIDKSVCHESVIIRGTLPNTLGVKEVSPLKCQTEKICVIPNAIPLIEEKGTCTEFTNSEGISYTKVSDSTQIEKLISQKVVDCWAMMGEGKISIFGGIGSYLAENYGFPVGVYPSCVICSRIAFSDNLGEKIGEEDLNDVNPLQYMLTHKIPNKEISYYGYLVGNSPARVSVEGFGDSITLKTSDNTQISDCRSFNNKETCEESMGCMWYENEGCYVIPEYTAVSLGGKELSSDSSDKELAILYMQISAPGHWDVAGNTLKTLLGIGAAGTFLFGPKFLSGTLSVGKSPWAWVAIALAGVVQQGSIYYNRGLTAGYCGDISTGGDARNGCSAVRVVNYDVEEIKKYCSVIESIS